MLASPPVPQLSGAVVPDIAGAFNSFPILLEISPLILTVLTMLVGIYVAAVSVILVYHWRRFPFEHAIFTSAERIYVAGVMALLTVVVAGILIS